jgi:hypothetical protein
VLRGHTLGYVHFSDCLIRYIVFYVADLFHFFSGVSAEAVLCFWAPRKDRSLSLPTSQHGSPSNDYTCPSPFVRLSHVFSVRRITGNLSEIASRIRQGRIKQIRADLPHDFPTKGDNSSLCSVPALSLYIALYLIFGFVRYWWLALYVAVSNKGLGMVIWWCVWAAALCTEQGAAVSWPKIKRFMIWCIYI